jgi:crotonyl-CoA carboxylase/reductase
VICAGTTGYNAVADLRYLWMRQKRLQGSHFANDEQAYAFNQLVLDRKIDPCLAKTYRFDEIPECHQAMHENRAPEGKMVALVGSPQAGLKDLRL